MRKSISAVAVLFVMVLGAYAMAADATAKPLHGKVTAVAKDTANSKLTDVTIATHGKKGETAVDTVVKIDDSTKITKGKDSGAIADIVVGASVTVVLGDGADKPAVSVDIHPAHKKPAAAK
jgi:cell shape-determining protein MreC